MLEPSQRTTIEALIPKGGRGSAWRSNARTRRTYALFEFADAPAVEEARRAIDASGMAIAYETSIIALAVFPAVAEALPFLYDALGGSGRPAGILACVPCESGIVVEWDPKRTDASIVLGLIDIELRRFNSARTTELLSPLSPETIARVASLQLRAPQIATDRILDVLLERAGLRPEQMRTDV